jgi:hypothetical protein
MIGLRRLESRADKTVDQLDPVDVSRLFLADPDLGPSSRAAYFGSISAFNAGGQRKAAETSPPACRDCFAEFVG